MTNLKQTDYSRVEIPEGKLRDRFREMFPYHDSLKIKINYPYSEKNETGQNSSSSSGKIDIYLVSKNELEDVLIFSKDHLSDTKEIDETAKQMARNEVTLRTILNTYLKKGDTVYF